MASLLQYPRTKPTTISWLGEVPEHWEVKRLKTVIERTSNGVWGDDETGDENDIVCYRAADFRYEHLSVGKTKLIVRNIRPGDRASKLIEDHFLLIEKSGGGDNTPVGRVVRPIPGMPAVCSNFLGFIEPRIDVVDPSYLLYGFAQLYTTGATWRSIKQTTGLQNLDTNAYFDEVIAVPPIPEQTHIARYLDHKTALIDAYLARKRRMMALLKEQRQALISQAVTKGLDPNAPMKDSGVEWIGELPAHWEVSRVKHMCSVRGRIGFRGYEKDDLVEPGEGALVIGGKHIGEDRLELSDPVYLSWAKYHESPEIMIEQGDIVVTQRGSLGKVAVIDQALGPATINPSMILLKEIGCDPSFFGYFFKSAFFKSYIDLINTSTAVPMISQDQLGNVAVPLPPRKEQLAIVQSLNDKLILIDDELTRIEASMERVREYRQALISAVVTGKVDVRGVEVPEIDQTMSDSEDQTMEEEAGMNAVDVLDEEA